MESCGALALGGGHLLTCLDWHWALVSPEDGSVRPLPLSVETRVLQVRPDEILFTEWSRPSTGPLYRLAI